MNILTHDQLDELVAFALDDKSPVTPEALEALNALTNMVSRSAIKNLTGLKKRNAMLDERVQKYQQRQNARIEAGEIGDTGMDSLDVATALLYQLQNRRTYMLNKYKIQEILYEMYASWLASKRQRLFVETPVATEYGPRFWRVYKRLNTYNKVTDDEWKRIASLNPGIAAFCKNAAEKYYDYREGALNKRFIASKAYKNADKDHNGGKWNKEIADADIIAWKESQKQ